MIHVFLFFLGSIIGSFINVVIDRWGTGKSIIQKRSHCEDCETTIKYIDLIPIVSFVLLRGRCRYCKTQISYRILIAEVLSALMLPLLFLLFGESLVTFVLVSFIFYILFSIFFIDLEFGIIPDKLTIGLLFGVILLISLVDSTSMLNHILSSVGALLFFLLLFIGTKGRGMGFGDVKLSFVLGLFLGFPNIVIALYAAFLTGAIVSIILVVWGKKNFSKGTIPFGPFLVAGAIVSHIYGDIIFQEFISRFL